MLYIATALYIEATPFIQEFSLKKNSSHTKFEVFESEHITLIITGVSKLQAAIALTYLFTLKPPTKEDILLNFGFCGSLDKQYPLGQILMIHKIVQESNSRACYPDCLFPQPLKEATLFSCDTMITSENLHTLKIPTDTALLDMEAYGIYQAALHFISQHQMFFLKMVSDYPEEGTTPQELLYRCKKLIEEETTLLLTWCKQYKDFTYQQPVPTFEKEEEALIDAVTTKLHLTTTMSLSLKQHLFYAKCLHRPIVDLLEGFLKEEQVVECKSKTEGKEYFHALKQLLKN